MGEYTPLITEARTPQFESEHDEAWGVNGRSPAERNDLVRRLTEALEAATADRAEHDRAVAANAWDEG